MASSCLLGLMNGLYLFFSRIDQENGGVLLSICSSNPDMEGSVMEFLAMLKF